MTNLFYIATYQTPHLETDLELIKNSSYENDTHVLLCKGHLKSCFANPENHKIKCNFCMSKIHYGLKDISDIKIHFQKKIDFEMPNIFNYDSYQKIINLEYDGVKIGHGILSSLITTIRDHKFDVQENLEIIKRSIFSAIMNYENFKFFIKKIKPTNIYLFNGRFSEIFPLMQYCRKHGIDFYTHERGADISRYMIRKNSIPHSINYAIKEIDNLWANGCENKFNIGKSFFEERIKGVEQSWYSFSKDQIKNSMPEGFDINKINISILNSSMDEYESIPDRENLVYKDDNSGIDKICNSFKNNNFINFYLRVHPNLLGLDNTQIREIKKLDQIHKNLKVIYADEKIDSYQLVNLSDAIITFNSTIGVEALNLGTKCILAGRAFYESINGIIKCNSHKQVVDEILKVKKNNKQKYSDHIKYGYWAKTFGIKFKYYKPEGLFKGKFMGKNLNQNKKTFIWRLLNKMFYS